MACDWLGLEMWLNNWIRDDAKIGACLSVHTCVKNLLNLELGRIIQSALPFGEVWN